MSGSELLEDAIDEDRRRNAQQKALKVPIEAVINFLDRLNPGSKCDFCKTGEYGVVPAPSGGTAGVVATPVPNVQHLGVWFYFATCTTCGHTIFFSAPMVHRAMATDH